MTGPIDEHELPIWPTFVAWCKRPIGRQSAFQAGVQGKPFIDPRDLDIALILVPNEPGPILQLVPRFSRWPSIARLSLIDAYRVGRGVRAIAHALDILGASEPAAMIVFENLARAAIPQQSGYSQHALIVDFVAELTRSHDESDVVELARRVHAYIAKTPHPMEYDLI